MKDKYVTKLENGAYRIAGTRVSLDSVVYSYKRGNLPETIIRQFPFLNLPQVYGAIAFYLSHREEIDEYLKQGEKEYEKLRQTQRQSDPDFFSRFDNLREKMKKESLASK
ncbi:MAG TPA: DUF433 domain-containing protein [Pyrinomonadaceae bacterium]|nr:DUF433 domain-containing protein [Pyrinomonadaceae bacterium]